MRNLILLLTIFFSHSIFANIPCDRVSRLVRIGNESMSIMRNRGFSDYVKTRFRRVIDNGREIDPSFFTRLSGARSVSSNRFGPNERDGLNPRDNLQDHYERHRDEFTNPPNSPNEYLRRARAFLANRDPNTVTINNRRGRTVKFNLETRELASVDSQGRVHTYHRVDLDFINERSTVRDFDDLTDWFYTMNWYDSN